MTATGISTDPEVATAEALLPEPWRDCAYRSRADGRTYGDRCPMCNRVIVAIADPTALDQYRVISQAWEILVPRAGCLVPVYTCTAKVCRDKVR